MSAIIEEHCEMNFQFSCCSKKSSQMLSIERSEMTFINESQIGVIAQNVNELS